MPVCLDQLGDRLVDAAARPPDTGPNLPGARYRSRRAFGFTGPVHRAVARHVEELLGGTVPYVPMSTTRYTRCG